MDFNSLIKIRRFKQILEDGFFHADPHPANLLIMENDKLALIDWGMVGRLIETDRFELSGILKSVKDRLYSDGIPADFEPKRFR